MQTPEPDLGIGIKRAHEGFARHVNRRRSETGHVFGARFHNGLVTRERHLIGCLRYIARNPVEAGICNSPSEWPWSAHRALAGLTDAPGFLDVETAYAHLGPSPAAARGSYLQLVAKSNAALLADLVRPDSDASLLAARHDFAIPIDDIAAFLGLSTSAAYARLAAARRNEGTVPSFLSAQG